MYAAYLLDILNHRVFVYAKVSGYKLNALAWLEDEQPVMDALEGSAVLSHFATPSTFTQLSVLMSL